MGRHTYANLHLLERFLVAQRKSRNNLGRCAVKAVCGRLHLIEMFRDQLNKLPVIQIPRGRNDEITRNETLPVEIKHKRLLKPFHGFLGAEDRLSEWMVLPEVLSENFMDEVVRIVLVHLDFFQNHSALADNVVHRKYGVQDEIRKHVEGDGQVLVQDLDVEADTLFGGEGVQVATDGIHLASNRFGGAVASSLEHHMLNEVRDPVGLCLFIAGTGLDPYADRYRPDMFHLLRDDGQPIRQNLPVNISQFFFHYAFRSHVFVVDLASSPASIFTHSHETWSRSCYSLYLNKLLPFVFQVLDVGMADGECRV